MLAAEAPEMMTSGFAPLSIIAPEPEMRGYTTTVVMFRQKRGFLPELATPRFKLRTSRALDPGEYVSAGNAEIM